jgi:hypothetical protein
MKRRSCLRSSGVSYLICPEPVYFFAVPVEPEVTVPLAVVPVGAEVTEVVVPLSVTAGEALPVTAGSSDGFAVSTGLVVSDGFTVADSVVVGFAVEVDWLVLLEQPAASARTSIAASEMAMICFLFIENLSFKRFSRFLSEGFHSL